VPKQGTLDNNSERQKRKERGNYSQNYGPVSMIKWSDKENVIMNLTYHGIEQEDENSITRRKRKPYWTAIKV
jgi:hypothetical protein